MHWRGHVGAALMAYAPIGTVLAQDGRGTLALVGAAGMIALATLPDGDQSIPFVAHRGFTHTVAFALLVGGAGGAVGFTLASTLPALGSPGFVGRFGILVGVLSVLVHLAADALTPMGVRPLWPLSGWHVSLSITKSESPLANYALLAAGVLAGASVLVVVIG